MAIPYTAASYDDLMSQREAISDIDLEIQTLLRRRRSHSLMAQAAKVQMGSPRVDIGRETVIIASYTDGGITQRVAEAILHYCKD
jgi:chorismate mutase